MEPAVRVLIVDDQRLFADLLKHVLDDADGIEVVGVAETAVKGYAMARERAPDVVLMDYHLPDGNGAQATANVLGVRPDTKVVMVTASDDESAFLAAIEAGCSGFISPEMRSTEFRPRANLRNYVKCGYGAPHHRYRAGATSGRGSGEDSVPSRHVRNRAQR